MLNVIIIEDEKAALQNLVAELSKIGEVEIITVLSTVKEGIEYLANHKAKVDLIFSDVQLSDGIAFEIFDTIDTGIPIIFITGYDQFILNAFEYNGIDYLIKPADEKSLRKAISKYHLLQNYFLNKTSINAIGQLLNTRKRTRLLVKKGAQFIALNLQDVVLFYTENKIVYAIDKNSKKFIVDKRLSELENELDKELFFRANRQFIVNANYIKGFKAYEKVKISVDLTIQDLDYFIIISQENAGQFRRWIAEA
ncbi:MAG: LytTR family DNA-binding domain-containing protein [Bacteroidota bacterium]|nr:response regulator transcription factor [Flavisolibacter sp.]MDQ3842779.1 LytTR family DNA-binding domain-containing protein [Bacteroidota bacterium]MBD0285340.1 response regulator transcription factor [Flavisolibacter sp.]MBD0296220.1 response regulator transcription factor [Flavisolibacter sp.]MBD0352196.1 response regulator transcription factor [Flavisolibacter sp.]